MRKKTPSSGPVNVPSPSESPTDGLGDHEAKDLSTTTPQRRNVKQVLTAIDAQVDDLMNATKQVRASLKKIQGAARNGDLVLLRTLLEEGKSVILSLGCHFVKTQALLVGSEASSLTDHAFYQEILTATHQEGRNFDSQDDEEFPFTALLELLKKKGPRSGNGTPKHHISPSAPIKRLTDVENKPFQFKTNAFLEILYTAYSIVVAGRGKSLIGIGTVIPLLDLYHLLTILPSQAKEYTKEEFSHDVYLLDESGKITTKNNHRLQFHASTGVRDASKALTVITKGGKEKTYYGISFLKIV